LFVSEPSGVENLRKEGVDGSRIFFVGNTMIDSLLNYLPKAEQSNILRELGLFPKEYIVVTLHRPANVDGKESLSSVLSVLKQISARKKVAFPIHPRTRAKIQEFGLVEVLNTPGIVFCDPLGYLDFIKLVKESSFVITDSGGIQEETTVLKVPCLTVRDNTERPITITEGTNVLVGTDFEKIIPYAEELFSGKVKSSEIPKFWDGGAAERIISLVG
jgi:UDP-N-acetylglucosamine 2-epimerase (non-hydrolysing)